MIKIRCDPSHRGTLLHALKDLHPPSWEYRMVWDAVFGEDDLILGRARYWRSDLDAHIAITEMKAIETVFTKCSLRDLQLVNSIALVQT